MTRRTVFADTLYLIATGDSTDQWHENVKALMRSCRVNAILTTDEVIVEYLNAISRGGPHIRASGLRLLKSLRTNDSVEIVPQSRSSLAAGLALYAARPDKSYSLTDCISMVTMRERGITEVLTHDHHFRQEGFVPLL